MIEQCISRAPKGLSSKASKGFRRSQSRRSSHSSRDVETHTITCGSSGSINVERLVEDCLYNRRSTSSNTPLIIYLPSSPATTSAPFPSFLSSHTIARINYRWNHLPSHHLSSSPFFKDHHFPVPLHDVLHAYTWLTSSLSPSGIYVYGSHLGGTLATSLALTESRSSKLAPQIKGLIAKDAVFDWTGVATSKEDTALSSDGNSNARTGGDCMWTTRTLHMLKSKLFSHPSQCFDSFASPLLFFRTAGLSVPDYFPGMEPPPTPTRTMLDNFYIDDDGNIVEGERLPPSTPEPEVRKAQEEVDISRKAHLTFPPRKSGLRIPRSLIISTVLSTPSKGKKDGELARQAQELVHVMRRSILLHESKDRMMWDESFDPHAESENRVRYREIQEDNPKQEEQAVIEWLEED